MSPHKPSSMADEQLLDSSEATTSEIKNIVHTQYNNVIIVFRILKGGAPFIALLSAIIGYKYFDTKMSLLLWFTLCGALGLCIYAACNELINSLQHYAESKEFIDTIFPDSATPQPQLFEKIIKVNSKFLEKYYRQTQEQASNSFKLAFFACVVGLIIIIIGVWLNYTNDSKNISTLTTIAGIINELISAVFFYLYNRTIIKMAQYHQKLILTQNISLALKATESLPTDDKKQSLQLIIDRLTTDINTHLANYAE